MVKVKVDGRVVEVKSGSTVMEACKESGVWVSRFCYNKRLLIAGNCRMCLVEVEGVGKCVASCSEEVREGMVVYTESSVVKKSREGVMEFLLLNHPLDCPVCDNGGECDLQDESERVGSERSRVYNHIRKEVREKEMGWLVGTSMKRCILCSRCVRYVSSISGSEELGIIHRGVDGEITMNVNERMALGSGVIGNIVDLCPVGYVCK